MEDRIKNQTTSENSQNHRNFGSNKVIKNTAKGDEQPADAGSNEKIIKYFENKEQLTAEGGISEIEIAKI